MLRKFKQTAYSFYCRLIGESPGKIVAWKILSKKRYPEPEFLKNYPIGHVIFDFYCDALHLAIDIIDNRYTTKQALERIKIIYKNNLLHFSWPSDKIKNDVSGFLYLIEFHRKSRLKENKHTIKRCNTEIGANTLLKQL